MVRRRAHRLILSWFPMGYALFKVMASRKKVKPFCGCESHEWQSLFFFFFCWVLAGSGCVSRQGPVAGRDSRKDCSCSTRKQLSQRLSQPQFASLVHVRLFRGFWKSVSWCNTTVIVVYTLKDYTVKCETWIIFNRGYTINSTSQFPVNVLNCAIWVHLLRIEANFTLSYTKNPFCVIVNK